MITGDEFSEIYWRVLTTAPFSNCHNRIADAVNELIADKARIIATYEAQYIALLISE